MLKNIHSKSLIVLAVLSIKLLALDTAIAQTQGRILVGPNIRVSRDHDLVFLEKSAAVDPANPQNVFVAAMFSEAGMGRSKSLVLNSRDGGNSWNTTLFPASGGDPMAGYGRTGTAYFVSIGTNPANKKAAYLFYRSEDGGATWSGPAALHLGDRPVLAVDHTKSRFAGNVYIKTLYMDAAGRRGYHIGLLRSTDDGRTWTGPVDISKDDGTSGRGRNGTFVGVFTDGELLVPFIEWASSPEAQKAAQESGKSLTSMDFRFATSRDGGVTFSAPQAHRIKGGGEISGQVPFYAIDNSDGPLRDRVYVVWNDPSFEFGPGEQPERSRLWFSYSSDRGRTWVKPKKVTAESPGHQFLPAIAVNREGTVAISWYETGDAPANEEKRFINRYVTASFDGGETFEPAARVSSAPSTNNRSIRNINARGMELMLSDSSRNIGPDYLPVIADPGGNFRVFWADDRTGSHQVWTAVIRAERNSKSSSAEIQLVEADVSKQVEIVFDPMLKLTPMDILELPVRLKNKSQQPIYGPITVEVRRLSSPYKTPPDILNAENGNKGTGAVFDYTKTLGGFESLAPGAVSDAIIWRFRNQVNRPSRTNLRLKVTARIGQPKQ